MIWTVDSHACKIGSDGTQGSVPRISSILAASPRPRSHRRTLAVTCILWTSMPTARGTATSSRSGTNPAPYCTLLSGGSGYAIPKRGTCCVGGVRFFARPDSESRAGTIRGSTRDLRVSLVNGEQSASDHCDHAPLSPSGIPARRPSSQPPVSEWPSPLVRQSLHALGACASVVLMRG